VNVQEYIQSGIVESYVLGLATPDESRAFEQFCTQYPELLAAREAFELSLEKAAFQNAVTPPASLENKVNKAIEPARVIAFPRSGFGQGWKYAAAIAVLLLSGSIYWNIRLYNSNRDLEQGYNAATGKLNTMTDEAHILQHPGMKMAAMKGMDASPASYATVYWDTASHDVFLLVNNMPMPPTDKQYQLWALLDGKPIDIGMIDNDYFLKQNRLLVKAKNVQHAEAFAITLEKKGGNPTPEGAVYVMGKL
jgi:anti-sigma-K factor RskA